MSSVTVRPARASDADAMGQLGAQLVREHHEFDPKRFVDPTAATPQAYARFLASQLERPEVIELVAELGGEVIGYVFGAMEGNDYMVLRGPAGELYDLVVDDPHRRQGIGTMLLDAALAELGKRGAPRVVLFTAERNAGAQAMFEHAGFRRTMVEMTRELG